MHQTKINKGMIKDVGIAFVRANGPDKIIAQANAQLIMYHFQKVFIEEEPNLFRLLF